MLVAMVTSVVKHPYKQPTFLLFHLESFCRNEIVGRGETAGDQDFFPPFPQCFQKPLFLELSKLRIML